MPLYACPAKPTFDRVGREFHANVLLRAAVDITCCFVLHDASTPPYRCGFHPYRVVSSVKSSFWRSDDRSAGTRSAGRAALCILCLALPVLVPQPVPAQEMAAATSPLRLRPGDGIRLLVLDEPRLTADLTILDDGTVMFPMIGLLNVTDVDFAEVERRVRSAYSKEVTTHQIVIRPLLRIAVLGEVRMPGLYVVDRSHDLADVLARAGGLGPSAAHNRILLIRDGASIALDMNDGAVALRDGVRPGDQIVVGRRSWLSENLPVVVGSTTSILVAFMTALLVR